MSCSNPLLALDCGYKIGKNGDQVRAIKFLDMKFKYRNRSLDDMKRLFGDRLLTLPCGHCYLCSLDYSRSWASRIMLEAKEHEHNCFITLTYGDWCVPSKPSKRDVQLFIKRLRRELDVPIRYFACGEVGDGKGDRGINPHYHMIIFGYDFPDKKFLKRSASGLMIYRSEQLEKLWSYKDKDGRLVPFGMVSIGDVSPESAQYVAKYSMKRKMSGVDRGEFVLMSRRPGIGINGYDPSDYDTDKLYIHGQTYKMPRYFDKLAEKRDPFVLWFAKDRRKIVVGSISSKKFQFGLEHEEDALVKLEKDRIKKDALKVRLM